MAQLVNKLSVEILAPESAIHGTFDGVVITQRPRSMGKKLEKVKKWWLLGKTNNFMGVGKRPAIAIVGGRINESMPPYLFNKEMLC